MAKITDTKLTADIDTQPIDEYVTFWGKIKGVIEKQTDLISLFNNIDNMYYDLNKRYLLLKAEVAKVVNIFVDDVQHNIKKIFLDKVDETSEGPINILTYEFNNESSEDLLDVARITTKEYVDNKIDLLDSKVSSDINELGSYIEDNYYESSEVDSLLDNYYTKDDINLTITNFYSKQECDNIFSKKIEYLKLVLIPWNSSLNGIDLDDFDSYKITDRRYIHDNEWVIDKFHTYDDLIEIFNNYYTCVAHIVGNKIYKPLSVFNLDTCEEVTPHNNINNNFFSGQSQGGITLLCSSDGSIKTIQYMNFGDNTKEITIDKSVFR